MVPMVTKEAHLLLQPVATGSSGGTCPKGVYVVPSIEGRCRRALVMEVLRHRRRVLKRRAWLRRIKDVRCRGALLSLCVCPRVVAVGPTRIDERSATGEGCDRVLIEGVNRVACVLAA